MDAEATGRDSCPLHDRMGGRDSADWAVISLMPPHNRMGMSPTGCIPGQTGRHLVLGHAIQAGQRTRRGGFVRRPAGHQVTTPQQGDAAGHPQGVLGLVRGWLTWALVVSGAVGSSITSSTGSCTSARAISASWRSPPLMAV